MSGYYSRLKKGKRKMDIYTLIENKIRPRLEALSIYAIMTTRKYLT